MHVGTRNNGLSEDLWFVDEGTEAQSSSMAHPRSGNVSRGSKGQTQVLLAPRPLYFHVIRYGTVFFAVLCVYVRVSALGLCCTQAFSSCSEQGLLLVSMYWFLIAVASLVEHRL